MADLDAPWRSRRSPVYARTGMVASSQPLASEIGVRILLAGGNAAGAAAPSSGPYTQAVAGRADTPGGQTRRWRWRRP